MASSQTMAAMEDETVVVISPTTGEANSAKLQVHSKEEAPLAMQAAANPADPVSPCYEEKRSIPILTLTDPDGEALSPEILGSETSTTSEDDEMEYSSENSFQALISLLSALPNGTTTAPRHQIPSSAEGIVREIRENLPHNLFPGWSKWVTVMVRIPAFSMWDQFTRRDSGNYGYYVTDWYKDPAFFFAGENTLHSLGLFEFKLISSDFRGTEAPIVYLNSTHRGKPYTTLLEYISDYLTNGGNKQKEINKALYRGGIIEVRIFSQEKRGKEDIEFLENCVLERYDYLWNTRLNDNFDSLELR